MKLKVAMLVTSMALLVTVLPIHAHHPFTAEYDPDKSVNVTGTVTQIEWANPHAHIFLDVKDTNGQVTKWEAELGGLKKLKDVGWKKDTVKMGDQITVNGWKARDGSNRVNANMVTLPNGDKYPGGSSYFTGKDKAPISN